MTNRCACGFKNIPPILNSRTFWSKGPFVAFWPDSAVSSIRRARKLSGDKLPSRAMWHRGLKMARNEGDEPCVCSNHSLEQAQIGFSGAGREFLRKLDPRHPGSHQTRQTADALLARIERQFGVPATLIMAIWTLESDNGTGDMGKLPVIRTLATLAHDCRRSELFQGELLATLQIVQRGDLHLRDLIGAYAGEIGQTQFLPSSSYVKYGVDYDGDGHVDLRHSVPDVLASTANLLKTNGWRANAPFGEGTANFEVMSEWNRSVVYRKTMVLFAERLAEP